MELSPPHYILFTNLKAKYGIRLYTQFIILYFTNLIPPPLPSYPFNPSIKLFNFQIIFLYIWLIYPSKQLQPNYWCFKSASYGIYNLINIQQICECQMNLQSMLCVKLMIIYSVLKFDRMNVPMQTNSKQLSKLSY